MPTTEITASRIIGGVKVTVSARFPVVGLAPAFEYEPIVISDFGSPDYQARIAAEIVKSLHQSVLAVELSQQDFALSQIS